MNVEYAASSQCAYTHTLQGVSICTEEIPDADAQDSFIIDVPAFTIGYTILPSGLRLEREIYDGPAAPRFIFLSAMARGGAFSANVE